MRRSWLVPVALVSLLAGACGDAATSGDVVATQGSTATTPTTAAATRTTTTTTTAARASTTTSTTTPGGSTGFGMGTVSGGSTQRGLLDAVRVTPEATFDRVTFEFEGPVPAYRVGYVQRPIHEDGSGNLVTVAGGAVISARFEPASGFDLSGEGRMVYEGPKRLAVSTSAVVDVVRIGDFEAVLEWAIGADRARPFRVRTETSPGRIVVEVQRAG